MRIGARKGLSWPANGTDLCGLGRRLYVCKKISLASATGTVSHTRLCPPNPVPVYPRLERQGGWTEGGRSTMKRGEKTDKLDGKHNAGVGPLANEVESRGYFIFLSITSAFVLFAGYTFPFVASSCRLMPCVHIVREDVASCASVLT